MAKIALDLEKRAEVLRENGWNPSRVSSNGRTLEIRHDPCGDTFLVRYAGRKTTEGLIKAMENHRCPVTTETN